MKKKILALCLVVVLAVTAVTGVTLAYFTDTDAQKNTFTVGKIDIDLVEDFTPDLPLNPAVGSAQDGTLKNGIEKEVWVENEAGTGNKDAYVRVHIAIPTAIDDGDPNFNATNNALHFNFSKESVATGLWSWGNTKDAAHVPGAGSNAWNFYSTKIGDVDYNVYVVTYKTALKPGEKTVNAIHQVYLDASVNYVTNEKVGEKENYTGYTQKVNGVVKELDLSNTAIYVVAEGTQTDGFDDDAYAALNAAFGTPGTYTIDWNAQNEQDIFVNND